jgi:hypothetical protein
MGRMPSDARRCAVVALVERDGRARAFPMPMINAENIHKAIREHVDPLNAEMMTDEANFYGASGRIGRRQHSTVSHARGEYVRGRAHTNTIEGFFSLLKRGIIGTFHHIGTEHVEKYCNEFAFRYSWRHVNDGERALQLFKGSEGKRLTYRQPATS